MAIVLRNTDPLCSVLAEAVNGVRAQIGAGSDFHLDAAEYEISFDDADSLATSLALVNQLRAWYVTHKADTLAHKAADTATLSAPAATDLATAITLANELKGDYATHRASTSWHYNADSTNTVASNNATDQDTLNTLVNELKDVFTAHGAGAPDGSSVRLVSA